MLLKNFKKLKFYTYKRVGVNKKENQKYKRKDMNELIIKTLRK